MQKIRKIMIITFGLIMTACAAQTPLGGSPQAPAAASATPVPPAVQESAPAAKADLEEQVRVAAAQTQAAVALHAVNALSPEQIQTAIALTQPVPPTQTEMPAALAPALNGEETALLTDEEIQEVIAEFDLDAPAPAILAAAPAGVSATYTPEPLVLQEVSPDQAFNGASVFRSGRLRHKTYMVTVQLSNATSGNFYGKMGKVVYKCFLLPNRADRLFCYGGNVRGGSMPFSVYEETTNRELFSGSVLLPVWTPTRLPSPTPLKFRVIDQ